MPQLPDMPLDGLYGRIIMDHYRHPRNRALVAAPDIHARELNPFCGDLAEVQMKLDAAGRVAHVGVQAEGCSIIQASASMMGEALAGKTPAELEALAARFRDWLQGRSPEGAADVPEGLQALQVVRQHPVRLKCVLLPWVALEEGVLAFLRRRAGEH
ncbi:MAG: SUF system NifU family Fe-S cluster assembly protein [Dehalococcoidia bacterium]|nr:SUF system NifU family Fe-S cluster assembly protein [Dehalococcoidia bacterium]MSQ17256.1 SUF system NifU family Fe-S cluster assembly protein [Dehalococcoidia bacterium]